MSGTIRWATPSFGAEEEAAVRDAMRSGQVSMGPRVRRFEERLAARLGVPHVVATSSGTSALDVALKALRVAPGDEVIVPAFTYVATVNAVVYQGATPVLVDVDPRTLNVAPDAVRRALGARTRCIVTIDYGGDPAGYDELEAIARGAGVALLHDAAHSFATVHRGRRPGAFGAAATLSFHVAKVPATIEGGAVVTGDAELAAAARSLRNQGEAADVKYRFDRIGANHRMSDLHAAIGLAQLAKVDELLAKRRAVVARYQELLDGIPGLRVPRERADTTHGWFLFSVRFADRATRHHAVVLLEEAGIETRVCWPRAIYHQPAYAGRLPDGACPSAEEAAATVLSLPLHAELTNDDVTRIAATVRIALGDVTR
ncbi:MAG TPA: DegT/DnrJ/EryC1/StrS aminotransferase family protein [Candidatus Binatia bacterium]